jgi:hypothetical protein
VNNAITETAVSATSATIPEGLSASGKPRVQARLLRVHADLSKPYPPAGEGKLWRDQLKKALASSSDAFVDVCLQQLMSACRGPGGGISEAALNSGLALVAAAEARDEIEAGLALQLAGTHAACMSILARLGNACGGERRVAAYASAAARLLVAYCRQIETLRRVRHGGVQTIRIERLDVRDGGQAVVGVVTPAMSATEVRSSSASSEAPLKVGDRDLQS